MTVATIRKALVATLSAFLAGFAVAYANGGWPGWSALGGMAIFAAVAGLATWAVPNARPVPTVAQHIKVGDVTTPALKAAIRAARRNGGHLL